MDFELLIWKKLRGEISASEAESLAQWLELSAENQAVARTIEKIWQESAHPTSMPNWDVDAEFQSLQHRIRTAESWEVKRGGKWTFLRVAAAVLILGVVGWQFFLKKGETEWKNIAATSAVEQVLLPDGSTIWLRQGSEISFPQHFDENLRQVRLVGEAFFEVQHRPDQPFMVKVSEGTQVDVLGTSFAIVPQINTTKVFVKTGKVKVSHPDASNSTILTAGQHSTFSRNTKQLVAQPNANENHLAWKTGELVFDNQQMRQVLADLESIFDIKLEIQNEALLDCKFTGTFDIQSVEAILENISIVFGAKLKQPSNGNFLLVGGHCKKPE